MFMADQLWEAWERVLENDGCDGVTGGAVRAARANRAIPWLTGRLEVAAIARFRC
jgi:hypothetical protein